MFTNTRNQSFYGTLFGKHKEDAYLIFVPSWIFFSSDLLEPFTITQAHKKSCTALQLKPHSKSFKANPRFLALLNEAIINYRSLMNGAKIPLLVNGGVEYLTIESMLPSNLKACFVHNAGKVDIQILESIECEEVLRFLFNKQAPRPITFIGKGYTVGGHQDPSLSLQEAAANAARLRMARISKGLKPY
jgi:hypothetical protein